MIYKYCRRCGKVLKGEENRKRGYGKTCFAKARAEAEKDLFLLVTPDRYPIEIGIAEQSEEPSRAESKSQGEEQSRARAKSQSKGREQSKAERKIQGQGAEKNFQEQVEKSKRGVPPHLEKTLTPTHRKPLFITPHTPPPIPI